MCITARVVKIIRLIRTRVQPSKILCAYTAWTGRFCEEDADGCLQSPYAAGVNCTDIPAPDIGATCGACPPGFSGDGQECVGMISQISLL